MRVLLDENLPKKLKRDFPRHEVFTVRDKGWNGRKNGDLLALMISEKFEVLMTFDQNLEHQQNFDTYPIGVLVLIAPMNTYTVLRPMVLKIKVILDGPLWKGVVRISE